MKKTFLLIASCLFPAMMFAQFEVAGSGFAASNNITVDGVMGMGTNSGVFTVKSNLVHPNFNPISNPFGRSLIRTDCGTVSAIYPYSNSYRGAINFYVNAKGQVYSVSGFLQPSATLTLNRSALPSLTSPLEKLKGINGVVYTTPVAGSSSRSAYEENLPRFGLVAQELEQVFPEVVRTLPDGSKGILYSDLIPVLIESIKELQVQVNDLQSQLNPVPQNSPRQGNQSSNGELGQEQAELYQNTPNPFNRETEIAYRLSGGASSASIRIYNLSGQQLKKYPLSADSRSGKIIISASEYTPGMYMYALVINNQVIDSKRMTLTD